MNAVSCVTQYLPVNERVFDELRRLRVGFACNSGLGGVFDLKFIKYDQTRSQYHFKVTNDGWQEERIVESSDLENKVLWRCKLPWDFYRKVDADSLVGVCVNEKTESEFERLRDSTLCSFSGLEFAGGVISYGKFTGWDAVTRKIDSISK